VHLPIKGFIFVTGATSGIGKSTALHALDDGYHVIAGCFPDLEPGVHLKQHAPDRVTLISLDVANDESVCEAGQKIANVVGEQGLKGLVNSAGIAILCPAELTTTEEFRQVVGINLVGTFSVTREMLPHLRKGRGTIVNISSDGGLLAMPTGGAYCASKFGVEALSDVLRAETHGQGVKVVVIEPGNIDTPIWETLHEPLKGKYVTLDSEQQQIYGDYFESLLATERQGIPVERVANVIITALNSRKPKTRYRVGPDSHVSWLVAKLPARIRDSLANRVVKSYASK